MGEGKAKDIISPMMAGATARAVVCVDRRGKRLRSACRLWRSKLPQHLAFACETTAPEVIVPPALPILRKLLP